MTRFVSISTWATIIFATLISTCYARTWTDREGRQIEAGLVSFNDGKVKIKRSSDGKVFDLPLERLSDKDQAFVKNAPKDANSDPKKEIKKEDQPEAKQPPPLQYTVWITSRLLHADRSGRDREGVLKTKSFDADQLRAWAEDPQAEEENRSATLYHDQDRYVEVIDRGPAGRLQYSIWSGRGGFDIGAGAASVVWGRPGIRTSRDRESVLMTRKMTDDQLNAWAQAPEGKAEGRVFKPGEDGQTMMTGRVPLICVTSRDGISLHRLVKTRDGEGLSHNQILKWVTDPKGEKENRGAGRLFQHEEYIWRGPEGQLLYSVYRKEGAPPGRLVGGRQTSRDRNSVLKTWEMTEEQVRTWVEDKEAAQEGRAAQFFLNQSMTEVNSRGSTREAVDPPF